MTKFSYLAACLLKYPFRTYHSCPNCGFPHSTIIDRKYVLTQLRRCTGCALLFRTPTDTPSDNKRFYNEDYSQGFTTDCPDDIFLTELKRSKFANTEKDYSYYISVLKQFGLSSRAKILDFGCSWGYGSWQLSQAGYDVWSYELGLTRRRYAIEKLGINHLDDPGAIGPRHPYSEMFDCFFTAHVLEHVPSPNLVAQIAWNALRDGGVFIAFTPNGSSSARAQRRFQWSKLWGQVHPNFLDDVYYERQFGRSARILFSAPMMEVQGPVQPNGCTRMDELSGAELGFLAVKNAAAKSW